MSLRWAADAAVPRWSIVVCRSRALGVLRATVIQRFGRGLQLNIHFHTLALDGVFSESQPGRLTFYPAPPPSDDDVARVLTTVRSRVGRRLTRHRLKPDDESGPADPLTETSPLLAGLVSASVQGCV